MEPCDVGDVGESADSVSYVLMPGLRKRSRAELRKLEAKCVIGFSAMQRGGDLEVAFSH